MGCSGSKPKESRQPTSVMQANKQNQHNANYKGYTPPKDVIENGQWSSNPYANNKGLYVNTGVTPSPQQYTKKDTTTHVSKSILTSRSNLAVNLVPTPKAVRRK